MLRDGRPTGNIRELDNLIKRIVIFEDEQNVIGEMRRQDAGAGQLQAVMLGEMRVETGPARRRHATRLCYTPSGKRISLHSSYSVSITWCLQR